MSSYSNEQKQKYCIYHNIDITKCEDSTCFLFDACKFGKLHKVIENMLKNEFKATCDEARLVARTLLLNSYRPESNRNLKKRK